MKTSRPIEEIIEQYKTCVPEAMVDFWEKNGLGTILNDYLRAIDPDEYMEFVKRTYKGTFYVQMIPVFSTAFGDLLIWAKNGQGRWGLGILKYKEADSDYVFPDMQMFLDELEKDPTAFDPRPGERGELEYGRYLRALKKWGPLEQDECFSYAPFLFLGKRKNVNNLHKVKMWECLHLIEQFIGGII